MGKKTTPTNLVEVDIEGDAAMVGGVIHRQMVETCMAYCKDCKRNVSEWVNYDQAVSDFIDHRREMHHA